MYATELAKTKTPTKWFYKKYILSQNEMDPNVPSRLQISFLLVNNASFFASDNPRYMLITQKFMDCNQNIQNLSNALTFAHQSEVPI